jgi:putative FmdB family regulatory protein
MPTYEYRCEKCGYVFEMIQKMNSSSSIECPECGASAQKMVPKGTAFVTKGSGSKGSCSFDDTGFTCCGANSRCKDGSCGE